jgi:hypothetical protein
MASEFTARKPIAPSPPRPKVHPTKATKRQAGTEIMGVPSGQTSSGRKTAKIRAPNAAPSNTSGVRVMICRVFYRRKRYCSSVVKRRCRPFCFSSRSCQSASVVGVVAGRFQKRKLGGGEILIRFRRPRLSGINERAG